MLGKYVPLSFLGVWKGHNFKCFLSFTDVPFWQSASYKCGVDAHTTLVTEGIQNMRLFGWRVVGTRKPRSIPVTSFSERCAQVRYKVFHRKHPKLITLCILLGTECREYLGDSVTMELPGREVALVARRSPIPQPLVPFLSSTELAQA